MAPPMLPPMPSWSKVMAMMSDSTQICLIVGTQLMGTIIILGFTKATSTYRLAALPIIFYCAYQYIVRISDVLPPSYATISGAFAGLFFLQYLSMALLTNWSYEAQGPTSYAPRLVEKCASDVVNRQGTVAQRLIFGFSSLMSFRDVNTPFEAKNAPHFRANDHEFVPSKPAFLARSTLTLGIFYLIIDFLESQVNEASIFAPRLVPIFSRLHEISMEEIITRIISSAGYWIMLGSMLTALHTFICIIGVLTNMSTVADCRPHRLHILRLYHARILGVRISSLPHNISSLLITARKFLPQSTRKTFSIPATSLTDEFLELLVFPLGVFPNRYTRLFFTFFISGLFHATADFAGGIPFAVSGSVRFFTMQAVGIVVEDALQALWKAVRGKKRGKGNPAWGKVVGSVWVVAFLSWTTPGWYFPSALNGAMGNGMGSVIPAGLSLFRALARR